MVFLDEVRAAVADPATVAAVIEHDLDPVEGAHTPVAPPTYAGSDGPEFPRSPEAPMPQPDSDGWLSQVRRDATGATVTAPSVVLDSVASQAGRAESALWQHRDAFGGLPGFVVSSPDDADPRAAGVAVSSWQASHRHVDAWIKYAAEQPGAAPLWASSDGVKSLLARINTSTDAREAFAYAPNSMLFGFWLSSGVAQLHRQARVYRSEIVGYGARAHYGAATKVDPVPSNNATQLSRQNFGMPVKAKQKDQVRPSELGFGPVPGSVAVRGFSCERIAARASVSLSALRGMGYGDEPGAAERCRSAAVALLVLGLAGDALGRQHTLLRSGCDVLPVASRVGWRVAGRATPVTLELPDEARSPQWWGQQLQTALQECRQAGLAFAEPVELVLSPAQQAAIVDAVARQESGEGEAS